MPSLLHSPVKFMAKGPLPGRSALNCYALAGGPEKHSHGHPVSPKLCQVGQHSQTDHRPRLRQKLLLIMQRAGNLSMPHLRHVSHALSRLCLLHLGVSQASFYGSLHACDKGPALFTA